MPKIPVAMGKKRLEKKLRAKQGGPAAAAINPNAQFEIGARAFTTGDYKAAVSAWHNIVDSPTAGEVASHIRPLLAEAYFRLALAQHARGREDSALTYIHEATTFAPENPIYHYHKGLTFHRQRNFKRAEEAYRDALARGSDRSRVLFHMGLLALEQNGPKGFHAWLTGPEGSSLTTQFREFMDAVAAINSGGDLPEIRGLKYGKKEPHLGGTYILYGVKAYENKDLTGALHLFKRACDVDPQNPQAFHHRAIAHAALGHLTDAIDDWETALSLGLTDDRAKRNIAEARRLHLAAVSGTGRLDRLIRELEAEVAQAGIRGKGAATEEAKSRLGLAYFVRGNSYAEEGEWKKAIRDWEGGLRLRPNVPDIAHNIALAYEKIEDYDQAIRYWRRAISLWSSGAPSERHNAKGTPQHLAIAYQHLGECLARSDDDEEAAHELEVSLSYDPDNTRARILLINIYRGLNDHKEAARHLEELLKRDPGNIEAMLDLALVLNEMGNENRALDLCRDASKIDPENPAPWIFMGFIYAYGGDDDAAYKHIDKGLQCASWSPEAYLLLARCVVTTGPRRTLLFVTLHYMEEAIERYPNNPELLFRRSMFYSVSQKIFGYCDEDDDDEDDYDEDKDDDDDYDEDED